jgi:ABC-type nitrate/sulfonate/bicarbonate transport system substrate-binding protein
LLFWLLSGHRILAEVQNLTVVSYPARPAKLPLWLAQDAGLFEKNGLKVSIKEMNSSEELLKSIQKREGQTYAATANWLVSGIGDGFDLVFIANTGYSVPNRITPEYLVREEPKEKAVPAMESSQTNHRVAELSYS